MKRAFVAVTLGVGLVLQAGLAQGVEICLAIDGSGSISAPDFNLQLQGIAQAVQNPSVVPPNGAVTLSVVQFGTSATLEVGPTVINSPTAASNFATAVQTITKDNGSTNMSGGIDTCVSQGFPFGAGQKQVIDLSTDGNPDSTSNTLTAADNAVTAGVDAINALGVGGGVSVSFLNMLVRPQPASTPPADGFVMLIPDFSAYVDAIAAKIKVEIGGGALQAPAVSGLVLVMLALGLAAFGFWVVQRRQASESK